MNKRDKAMAFNSFETKKISESNPLNTFITQLSDEERAMPINKLPPTRIAQYIRAIFEFQVSVMPDLEQNATRSMMVLLNEMSHAEVSGMDLSIGFEGSKDEVREETFHIQIQQINADEKNEELPPEDEKNSALLRQTHGKIGLFVHNDEKIVNLFKQLCEKIPTPNNSNIALLTAGVLVVFEYLSFKNIARVCFVIEAQSTPIKTAMHNAMEQRFASQAKDLDFDSSPVFSAKLESRFYRAIFDRQEIEYILTYRPETHYKN